MTQSIESLQQKLKVYEDKAARVQAKLDQTNAIIADLKEKIQAAEASATTE